jgi:hypothetical protein
VAFAIPLTVCGLLKDLPSYRGKLVVVTGIYWDGLRQHCPEALVTGGHPWPSALSLVDSHFPAGGDEAAGFETDHKSWADLEALVLREARAGHREEIWVTVIGQIRAPTSFVRGDGQVVGGYGHLGVLPGQLVLKRLVSTSIKPVPTYDYGELLRHPGPR